MNNPIEKSLNNMADISKLIMEKAVKTGELSQADILILGMYQKEKAMARAVPVYKKIIGGIKEVSQLIKDFAPKDTNTQIIADSKEIEVDTDVI